jgi:benzoyl-CoA reductase/2-hydroxyglutaryl-CoA dehydratase subunit BcrC/BadD/HgdB
MKDDVRGTEPDEQVFKTLKMAKEKPPSIFLEDSLCQVAVIYRGQSRQMSNCVVRFIAS